MSGRQYQQVAYGLTQALIPENPSPVIGKRAPTTADFALPTTLWVNTVANTAYILTSVANNAASWLTLGAGGVGNFTSLTVTPGPISLTGTTTINTAGAATTTIGTGGTGAVDIGNATGGTNVTGPLTATGNIESTAGNIIALGGNVELGNAAAAFQFANGVLIVSGTGDPNGAVNAPEGSLYLNTNGTGVADRAWINTNSGTVWTSITTAT